MSNIVTARGQIRESVINSMDKSELRLLVAKVEEAIENGNKTDEYLLEAYISEVLAERNYEGIEEDDE